jgi:hypothetical protein
MTRSRRATHLLAAGDGPGVVLHQYPAQHLDRRDLRVHPDPELAVVVAPAARPTCGTVADVISFLSFYLTIEPGDIIAMGTALKPSRRAAPPSRTSAWSRWAARSTSPSPGSAP